MPRYDEREQHDHERAPDYFDRLIGNLDGLPDVTVTKQSTIQNVPPFGVGGTQTFIVQTYRQREQGDTIFLQCVSGAQTIRLVIPAKVADVIARQRDALTSKSRSIAGKTQAAARKERGELPGFMKSKSK
jgi:hypothetical protein